MKRFLVPAVLMLASVPAFAQEQPKAPPSPEQMRQIMDATLGAMVPFMSKMVEAMIQSQLDVVSRPESADKMARYVRNFHDALIKQGFSKQEALQIVTSVAMPSAAPPAK
jgi:hypothetical protein